MRIPFDSLVLSAVTAELQRFVGSKVQRISQLDEYTIVLGLYGPGGEAYLLLSCDPVFARTHLVTKRPLNSPQPPRFCTSLRSTLDQSRLRSVEQLNFDRILVLTFEQLDGPYRLVAELMGKHANLIFLDGQDKVIAAAKHIGPQMSVRPVLPGRPYAPPPVARKPSLMHAGPNDDPREYEGASPFLLKLMFSMSDGITTIQRVVQAGNFAPVFSPGNGAYAVSVSPLGIPELPRTSMSIALEQHYALAVPQQHLEQLRHSLLAQLNRVLLSREAAISDLLQASDAARHAGGMQLRGELLLAYGPGLEPGVKKLETQDYEGEPLSIPLDPELTYLENANAFFDKAKRAKAREPLIRDQLERLRAEADEITNIVHTVESCANLSEMLDILAKARKRKWLHNQLPGSTKKEDRPYEGHRVRELTGPGGVTVLFGENATSNDYLTLRVAKPDDYWLHVRGGNSAHVVIRTERHPEKVGRELLMFAAKVAVLNSPSKHSGFVPVDYTLKKYVRKPKGSPVGTALYTHEKTLHVES